MRKRRHHRLPSLGVLLALACASSGLATSAVSSRATGAEATLAAPVAGDAAQTLREALRSGDFDRFVDLALAPSRSSALGETDPALLRLQVEALLSVGKNAAADALAANSLGATEHRFGSAAPACDDLLLKQWLTARWRQGRPLDDGWLERRCRESNFSGSPTLAAAAFWREALAGAAPYRFIGSPVIASLPLQAAGAGSEFDQALRAAPSWRQARRAAELEWVAVEINQVRLPRALIDTGAQHTLISSAAAAAAGVEYAAQAFAITGFAQFSARPGILRKLEIGGLALADVPVLVGDSPALGEAEGQAALGIDLLSHLRVVLDYPARRLIVARADRGDTASLSAVSPVSTGRESDATIPLWTFSYAVLAQGQLSNRRYARTLIDTGAGSGAYVSTVWADDAARGFSAASGRLVSRRRQAHRLLGDWRIGEFRLTGGGVRGMLPSDLDRLDAFDVLVGHEALAGRRVEIDLAARRLMLSEVQLGRATESVPLSE